MLLESRPAGWFTSNIELRLNGELLGIVQHHWLNEGMDLDLMRLPVRFEKPSWLKSHFVLKDAEGNELGSATVRGLFRSSWEMDLQSGPGTLERAGWFTRGYLLKQGVNITARVAPKGWFSREWTVEAEDSLPAVDVLLVGLTYLVIRRRESQQNSAAG
ncbi:MAG: hypothetical protein WCH39_09015 [Schlesneria sp.]